MREGLFLSIIYRYFIKSKVLKRSFRMKSFERFFKIRQAEKFEKEINRLKTKNKLEGLNNGF